MGSRKCYEVRFDFLGGRVGIWVVVADGIADDEIYERADAYPSATEDYDHVGFIHLEGSECERAEVSKGG